MNCEEVEALKTHFYKSSLLEIVLFHLYNIQCSSESSIYKMNKT